MTDSIIKKKLRFFYFKIVLAFVAFSTLLASASQFRLSKGAIRAYRGTTSWVAEEAKPRFVVSAATLTYDIFYKALNK